MFHKKKSQPFLRFQATDGKQFFKRAATLSAGIFFLWIALHIMPKPGVNIPASEASPDVATAGLPDSSENRSGTQNFMKSTQVVAGILLLALIGYMVYRHKKTGQERASIKSLKTLNRLQLAPNQHLYLVECGQDALLIGASNTQVTLLKEVPLESLTHQQFDESTRSVSYSFTTPVSTQQEPGDFASLLHSYTSASNN